MLFRSILRLSVEGHGPSNDLLAPLARTRRLDVTVEWSGAQPINTVEIVRDGIVVAREVNAAGALAGTMRTRVHAGEAGWLAARAWGRARTSYGHALWAHTSPIYLRPTAEPATRRADALAFVDRIDQAIEWVQTVGRFVDGGQRARVVELLREGRRVYEGLSQG